MGRFRKLVFLGTGASKPHPPYRNTSAVALKLESGKIILLDCGEATQHQLRLTSLLRLSKIDTILVSHLHGDHCLGLFGLIATMNLEGRTSKLTIVGPAGIQLLVETVLKLTYTLAYHVFPIIFIEIPIEKSPYTSVFRNSDSDTSSPHLETKQVEEISLNISVEEIQITAIPMEHCVPCFGYILKEPRRTGPLNSKLAMEMGAIGPQLGQLKHGNDVTLSDGRIIYSKDVLENSSPGMTFAYLTDTVDSIPLINACMNIDVVIHDCTYGSSLTRKARAYSHSTTEKAGFFARSIHAKCLILTHFSPRYRPYKSDTNPNILLDPTTSLVPLLNNKDKEKKISERVFSSPSPCCKIDLDLDEVESKKHQKLGNQTDLLQEAQLSAGQEIKVYAARDFFWVNMSPGYEAGMDVTKTGFLGNPDGVSVSCIKDFPYGGCFY